ncbi:MAG: DsbA family protein [Actinomycetota bacterium]|nr:DsbA family protein [Actinomycetota bacterium]
MNAEPGTIVVYSDIGCPWAHVAVARLLATRRRLGLDDQVALDHRAFPLELHNRQPTPWRVLAAEIPVVGGIAPEAGWRMWQAEPWTWPVTTLPALEAVQAAKEQGLPASERLDRALRVALFRDSLCVSLRHVVLEVAADTDGVDKSKLRDALDDGRAHRAVIEQFETSRSQQVDGSPHLFLPDGTDVANPGVEMHWEGEHGRGFPVVDSDDPGVYERILERAAGS